jgi:hypothetical protein
MKKILILLILVFTLVGCEKPIVNEEVLNDNINAEIEGYVLVKSTQYSGIYMVYFDPNEYIWYDDETYDELQERDYEYLYTPIEVLPFYRLVNVNKVMIYSTGRNSYEIFVKASDIHTIKIEV